jgi:hypothetical protein
MHPVAKELSVKLYNSDLYKSLAITNKQKKELLQFAIKKKELVAILTIASELQDDISIEKYFPKDSLSQIQLLSNQLSKKLLYIMLSRLDAKNICNMRYFNEHFIFNQKSLTKELKSLYTKLET